eukprot:Amastigsp_a844094_12.p3 type:complete len:220 gc:universal Amastigsp_a844094_12:126-785(+)
MVLKVGTTVGYSSSPSSSPAGSARADSSAGPASPASPAAESSSESKSPSTSWFCFSRSSSIWVRSFSSRSDVARGAVLTTSFPPAASIDVRTRPIASLSRSMPAFLSSVLVTITKSGGATSLTSTSPSGRETSPAERAALMALMPSYEKHETSMSARIFNRCGVMRRSMFLRSTSLISGSSSNSPRIASGSMSARLKASNAWPYLRYSGQPNLTYNDSS